MIELGLCVGHSPGCPEVCKDIIFYSQGVSNVVDEIAHTDK